MSKSDYTISFKVSPEVYDHLTKTYSKKQAEDQEIKLICCQLILNSRWASWLPFGWMHSLAAAYYVRKARKIYNNQKLNN